jgi:N utilization substance protein B
MRSQARESVFKYIFSKLFNPSDEGLFAVLCKELSQDDKQFANELLQAIETDGQKYLNNIDRLSVTYKLNRIRPADKCALILGMAELDKFKSTPKAVVIDEAVNLVAKFSTENSTGFVNGILAEYSKEI